MQYSIVKDLLGEPWQVEATTFQRFFPLAAGALNGAEFTVEPEPAANLPFAVSAATGNRLANWHTSEFHDEPGNGGNEDNDDVVLEKVIHVLPVRDVLMKHDMLCGPAGTRTLAKRLRDADADDSVIGHILLIESGGGAANAVPELAEAIEACQKPVVAWVDGIMCSAAMYVGSYAKEVIASRGTDLIGCIGTMIVFEGRKAVSEEDITKTIHVRIYADEATEKNEEYETAINDFNFKLVKDNVLNPHNAQFVADILKNRPGAEDKHLHGRTFKAQDVVGSLVDSIGPFDFATERVISLAGFSISQNTPPEDSQTNFNSNMTLTRLTEVLGYESLEFETDGRRTFTIEEMEALEAALGQDSHAEEVEQLTAQATASASEIERLGSQLSQATEDISARDARIEELTAETERLQVENGQLRQMPAAVTALAATDRETVGSKKPVQVTEQFENFGEQVAAVAKEYLGKDTL